ncbi:MAG: potassium transporter TrkA [Anaerolineae bacterium]|nr:potassium transporter TrkA [Anaerolineae bacterium]
MRQRAQWQKQLSYYIDTLFSQGLGALVAWLAVLSLLVISLSAAVMVITGIAPPNESPYDFIEAAWLSLVRTLGGGSIGGRETAWSFRLLMLGVTLGGVFVISALISVLTNAMNARMVELRKGRSQVMEKDHIVILGWSEQIFTIVPELLLANAEKRCTTVVILGEKDKVEMEDVIRERVKPGRGVRIVCRNGNPMEMSDLGIVSLNTAREIIVLTPESETPDADVLKIVLAVLNHPERRSQPYHIVAGIRNPKNLAVAQSIGKHEVEWIRIGDFVARIIAQTCRQSGLSVVYTELLDFSNGEIYIHEEPELVGKSFGEALLSYENDTVIGLYQMNQSPKLNLPMDTVIQPGDKLVIISRDDSQIQYTGSRRYQPGVIQERVIRSKPFAKAQPERTLLLGWNWRAPRILAELDQYVADGSEVRVVAERLGIEDEIAEGCRDLVHQRVCYQKGDTTDRQTLEELHPEGYDHVILLTCAENVSKQQADAQTLITLLHLRDIADQKKASFSIVTEMLDPRNSKLAAVTRADDFIVSNRLVSLMMSQVAESKMINSVFNDLFDPAGSEIYLKPVKKYVQPGEEVNFYTLVEAAQRRGEVAIGYRLEAQSKDANSAYGVVLNPPKAEKVIFGREDKLIVLAEG